MPRKDRDRSPLTDLAWRLRHHGLTLRGAFHPAREDGVPTLAAGGPARTVALIGNAGPAMWRRFRDLPRRSADPLDHWSRQTIDPIASAAGGEAVYPFDGPPWLPFQRWAVRAEGLQPSPLGSLIHPVYGLWHAYRGAVLFADRLELPRRRPLSPPCDECPDEPCRTACPAGALADGYDVPACAAHVASAAGGDCNDDGCLARRACPVGRRYAYDDDQAAFHISAFRRNMA